MLCNVSDVASQALCDMANVFAPCEFRIKWASSAWEKDEARRLRRAVFCIEQGIFIGDDSDAIDERAQTLVALSMVGGMADQVVGTVRIHEEARGLWWGSRLAVHAAFRNHGRIGATLIQLAVRSANSLGCNRFLAHVQSQNVPMFERLHWNEMARESIHGRPHAMMQAALEFYPACDDPVTGLVARSVPRTQGTVAA